MLHGEWLKKDPMDDVIQMRIYVPKLSNVNRDGLGGQMKIFRRDEIVQTSNGLNMWRKDDHLDTG